MRLFLLPVLLLLPAALAAQQPAATARRAVAGCYTLDLGPWRPTLRASPAHSLPARVVLDTAAAGARGTFRVLPAPGAASTHEAATWAPLPFKPDSLRIRWATGGAGVDARLRAGVGELRGRATAFTPRAPGGVATATLVARRTAGCGPGAVAPTAGGATELTGLEARGTPTPREPADAPQTAGEPAVEAARIPPPPPPPPGRTEQIAGYTVLGLIAWLLVNFAGIL